MKQRIKKVLKKIVIVAGIVGIVALLMVVYADWKIPHDTRAYIFNDVDSIPPQKVALVLGAAKTLGQRANPYFQYRMQAAKKLYDAGKVKAFIVSGDNRTHDYNEPEDMRQSLIEMGVPDSIIYLDYAGLRTLDSVVRSNKIFGQDSIIVVSQEFHNERAVFLAQYYGMTAYGYNARDLTLNRSSSRTKVREKFARVKVFVDIVLGKGPRHLGEPVEVK